MEYKKPSVTVDTIIQRHSKIALIKRVHEPWKDFLALPGGFVNENETIEEAAIRESKEETNLKVKLKEILGVYSKPKRDPRCWIITAVFVADYISGELKGADDAKDAKWFSVGEIDFNNLAGDHGKIISDYIKWKKQKGTFWSTR